tara:strand:+ start:1237 stop:1647 length:411 start_codon:yes stop_codon:yes gene_type:complete
MGLTVFLASGIGFSQDQSPLQPLLTVRQIMNAIVTPTTATIWGGYELETDAEWQEIKNAALAVIGAGNLLKIGGSGLEEQLISQEKDWQTFNSEMIAAAEKVIEAVDAKDEDELFMVGNDLLYPPCESCHQQYQNQ